jgi:hypothetical protein
MSDKLYLVVGDAEDSLEAEVFKVFDSFADCLEYVHNLPEELAGKAHAIFGEEDFNPANIHDLKVGTRVKWENGKLRKD